MLNVIFLLYRQTRTQSEISSLTKKLTERIDLSAFLIIIKEFEPVSRKPLLSEISNPGNNHRIATLTQT